ncbi:helix-turn-helix domain-containing protein [Aquihabitans daechungensis]|uniref:helix-turn-helix domain-containing protein n=1 Tax=Aquihabitans daechungensis TaxID=1052257 RepID=UPI003BA2A344
MVSRFEAELGGHLQAERERSGLSQDALAQQFGVDQSLISRVERGQRRVSVEEFLLWADLVGADPVALFGTVAQRWEQTRRRTGSIWLSEAEPDG